MALPDHRERRASQAELDRMQALNTSLEAEKNRESARASELGKEIGALESRRAADAAESSADRTEAIEGRPTAARLRRGRASSKQIKDLQGMRAADQQRLTELQRLRDEKDRTDKAVNEREQLIDDNRRQVEQPGQGSSEFLRRINELQGQLKQAWDERDAVRTESSQVKQALAQNKIVPAMMLRTNVPVMFPKDSPVVAFVTPLYSGAAPLYVIPLAVSRRECGPGSPQTECLLNIITEPGPSCPSGAPLYCFDVREPKTNMSCSSSGRWRSGRSPMRCIPGAGRESPAPTRTRSTSDSCRLVQRKHCHRRRGSADSSLRLTATVDLTRSLEPSGVEGGATAERLFRQAMWKPRFGPRDLRPLNTGVRRWGKRRSPRHPQGSFAVRARASRRES